MTDVDPWEPVAIDDWPRFMVETVGSEGASWRAGPDGTVWLHKDANSYDDGHVDGEDWAEVATTAIGDLLGVPCARTRLCTSNDKRGSLSKRINDRREHDFREGGLLLLDTYGQPVEDDLLDHPIPGHRTRKKGHSLSVIRTALSDVEPPLEFTGPPGLTSFDVFAGYLVLDTLISNRDRHEQNWAVLEPTLGNAPLRLAPSFDHGSAFGYNMRPKTQQRFIHDQNYRQAWLERGTAHRLEHTKPPGPRTLIDVALAALDMATREAREHWRQVIFSFELDQAIEKLEPARYIMSVPSYTVTIEMLKDNKRRFCDAVTSHQ